MQACDLYNIRLLMGIVSGIGTMWYPESHYYNWVEWEEGKLEMTNKFVYT